MRSPSQSADLDETRETDKTGTTGHGCLPLWELLKTTLWLPGDIVRVVFYVALGSSPAERCDPRSATA